MAAEIGEWVLELANDGGRIEACNHIFNDEQRKFIVGLFACYYAPHQVIEELLKRWPRLPKGRLTTSLINRYNPNTGTGYSQISEANLQFFLDIRSEYDRRITEMGISSRTGRQERRNEHWEKLKTAIEERAELNKDEESPILRTGLGVKRKVALGGGEISEEVALDTPILNALSDLEDAAATEMGHKKTTTLINAQKTIIGVNLDEI